MFSGRKHAEYARIKNEENHFRAVLLFAICGVSRSANGLHKTIPLC